nr:adenosylcobinamide-GDP ribazoletransferase [Sulfobacillus harzensis]
MRKVLQSLALVVTFGTIVPMPVVGRVYYHALRRSMGFFPVVGWGLGLLLWGLMWAGKHFVAHFPAAVVTLALYVLMTGALHLDGLADTFDALGSRRSGPEALAVMKDSRIGTMGAVAVILVLMGKAIAFSHLPVYDFGVWVVVPVLARTSVVWLMMEVPAARPEGLGTLYAGQLSKWTLAGATVVGVLTTVGLLPWRQALELLILSTGVTLLWGLLICRRFGGATGDTYGALLEIVEWVGFLTLTGGWGFGR